MKIGKASRWILTIGIVVILLVSAAVVYSRQKAEQTRLGSEIARAQQNLTIQTKKVAKSTVDKKDLETKLNEADSQIISSQGKFPSPTQSIEMSRSLFEAADDANVTITGLSFSIPKKEKLNGITYDALSLSLTAEGELVALLSFSSKVSQRFPTATIDSATINVFQKSTSLDLRSRIYGYGRE